MGSVQLTAGAYRLIDVQQGILPLALRVGRGVQRATMLEALWPDADSIHASQSLNSLIYSVNKLLGGVSSGTTAWIQGI